MCLDQFMEQNGIPLIPISITLAALGFSIFSTIYSNLVHDAEMAEGNVFQSSGTSYRYWRKASNNFRELARSRAYSANLCYLSLLFIIAALITYFTPLTKYVCFATFVIGVMLLIVALIFAAFFVGYRRATKRASKKRGGFRRCLLKLLHRFLWPVNPNVKRLTENY
jgi:small-conductance mechanosensitive channel